MPVSHRQVILGLTSKTSVVGSLAGEGLRFNDLRRWSGKDGGTNCEAAVALQRQEGTRVNYTGTWTTMSHGKGVGGSRLGTALC